MLCKLEKKEVIYKGKDRGTGEVLYWVGPFLLLQILYQMKKKMAAIACHMKKAFLETHTSIWYYILLHFSFYLLVHEVWFKDSGFGKSQIKLQFTMISEM